MEIEMSDVNKSEITWKVKHGSTVKGSDVEEMFVSDYSELPDWLDISGKSVPPERIFELTLNEEKFIRFLEHMHEHVGINGAWTLDNLNINQMRNGTSTIKVYIQHPDITQDEIDSLKMLFKFL